MQVYPASTPEQQRNCVNPLPNRDAAFEKLTSAASLYCRNWVLQLPTAPTATVIAMRAVSQLNETSASPAINADAI